MRLLILSAILIVGFSAARARAQSPEIEFTGGSKASVIESYLDGDGVKIVRVAEKEFTAELYSIRKANYVFNNKTLRSLHKKKASLANQIARIDSAYEIKQGGETYGFAAFNSIDFGKLKNCIGKTTACKIKCAAFLITIDDGGKRENILIIKSITKIK